MPKNAAFWKRTAELEPQQNGWFRRESKLAGLVSNLKLLTTPFWFLPNPDGGVQSRAWLHLRALSLPSVASASAGSALFTTTFDRGGKWPSKNPRQSQEMVSSHLSTQVVWSWKYTGDFLYGRTQ